MDNGGCCLIVTGAPGSGKSTVSRLVAGRLNRSAVLNGDQVNRLVVSGRVGPLDRPAAEAARQVQLCNENLCALAANFADAGITPVIDWIIPDRAQLDFYHLALSPRRVLLVVLAPSIDACRHRNAERDPEDQFFFEGYESLAAEMRRGFGTMGWWFDTTALTADETAARIVAEAPRLAGHGFTRLSQ
ncbi:AAA family ATPase [Nocardioides szechwanensis]|uniref:AAA family ATPase n=1 Tax=Nocardioides szechwanensis TaxID=1005944 RepID=UPI001FE19CE7|nr:AAA family ATPase [Nocardioides szechwanensis]